MTTPRRALIIIDAQQEYFTGLLPIQYPDRDFSLAQMRSAIRTAQDTDTPVVIVTHELPEGSPVFATGSSTVTTHPDITAVEPTSVTHLSKHFSSIFSDTDLAGWLAEQNIDTITLAGYMTNNCVLASAAAAEPLGIDVEVLSDATGAIDITNAAGTVRARQVHDTIMAVLHSNWAAVTDTDTWTTAVRHGDSLDKSDLVSSAVPGPAGI